MKTMETTRAKLNAKAFDYILSNIDNEGYEDKELKTAKEKLEFLASTFKSEYCFKDNLRYYGSYQKMLANWLMGLPSSIHIEFRNHAIIEIAKKWKSIPHDATEKQEDKILENWFNFIAAKTMQLFAKHKIEIYI